MILVEVGGWSSVVIQHPVSGSPPVAHEPTGVQERKVAVNNDPLACKGPCGEWAVKYMRKELA